MPSWIVVLLVCFTFSSGIILFLRAYNTPPPLPTNKALGVDRREKLGSEISGLIKVNDSGLAHELDLIDKPASVLVYEQFLGSVTGVAAALVFGFLFLADSLLLAFLIVALFAMLGWVVPKKKVEREASELKSAMRQALAIYQELAATAVAGGQSVQSALRNAAGYGDGSAWIQLRNAAAVSMTSEQTFSGEIRKLGDLYRLPELDNLAGLVQVADEGGTSKTTLKDLARQQSRKFSQQMLDESESNTSRLIVPTALIFLSFVLLLGFAVIDGLSQINL